MRSILITGGTGTFGQAYARRCLDRDRFEKVVIYSRDEMKQDQMREIFQDHKDHYKLRFFIGDVRDKERLYLAMRGINYIVHAAALKIVPSLEYNPIEAVKTNILGAQNIIENALGEPNPSLLQKAVCISTDKAVMPINLYGATKLAMEKLWAAANNMDDRGYPRFSIVRYGNVVGSRGSVIPIFANCKEYRLSAPVTHPDMTRFWLTVDEALDLVDQAIYNRSKILHVPEMPAYKISDLVDAFGLKPNYVGIRPGEKMHESILTPNEAEEMGVPYVTSETARRMSVEELQTKLRELEYYV